MEPLTYIIAGAVGYSMMAKAYSWYAGDDERIPNDLLDDIKRDNVKLKPVVGTRIDDELVKVLEERRKRIAGPSK